MKKLLQYFIIVKKIKLNDEFFILKLQSEDNLPLIQPAQFVEIKVEDAKDTFLRRPFSIHDVNYEKNTITLLIKISGNASYELSEMQIGRMINVLFPIGTPYTISYNTSKLLLIGGGCGIAPLLYTAKYFSLFGIEITFLLGFRNKESIILKDKFAKYGNLFFSTDDGSYGEKGNVMQHSLLNSEFFRYDKILACGPKPMLKAVSEWSINNNINCEVSLENMMACGIGACLCCVQNTTDGHKCVCTDGPVFNAKQIIW